MTLQNFIGPLWIDLKKVDRLQSRSEACFAPVVRPFLWRHHPATRVAAWACKLANELGGMPRPLCRELWG